MIPIDAMAKAVYMGVFENGTLPDGIQATAFKNGTLKKTQSLPIKKELREYIDSCLVNATPDKRFVYYLLASTGVCVVPLSSGFNSSLNGFRFLLLEPSDAKFKKTINTIAKAISDYTAS